MKLDGEVIVNHFGEKSLDKLLVLIPYEIAIHLNIAENISGTL